MSLSNRLHNLAVRGCLIAAFAVGAAGLCHGQDPTGNTDNASQTESQKTPAEAPERDPFKLGYKGEPGTYRAICAEPKDREQADLCQQWRSAEAAERSVRLNRTQIWIGAFGLAAVALSLLLSGAAVWLAAKSAREAGKSAAAADRTARIMQDTAERQLRAYVSVTGAIKTKRPDALDGPGFSVAVSIKNAGQTPAYEFTQWAMVDVREYPLKEPFPIYCRNFANRGVLGPTSETLAFPGFKRDLTPLEEQAIIESGKAIYVYGEIDYRDAFRKQRRATFRFQCSGQGYSMGLFKADGEGNEAD